MLAGIYSPPPPAATEEVPGFRSSIRDENSGDSQPTRPLPLSKPETGRSTGMVVGISVGCAAAILFLILVLVIWWRRKKKGGAESDSFAGKVTSLQKNQQPSNLSVGLQSTSSLSQPPPCSMSNTGCSGLTSPGSYSLYQTTSTFTYNELEKATNGFSDSNLLGEGGFGYVHKGILPNGMEVAVKQLKAGSGQGEREFQAEVETISRVQHKHLVSLVGYCLMGDWKMLVYEYVPNNNLEFHLHGNETSVMDWSTRLKIALGAAKGLAYLHEECNPKIIHRDIKASNILLDLEFEAKVADFGLAKLFSDTQTHVSTRVMGTFGYLAPEYAFSGKLTEKSDVYSFGVLLLELITGRPPVQKNKSLNSKSLVDWARPLLTRALDDGNLDGLVDKRIRGGHNRKEMARAMACAAACVFHSAKDRPKMSKVVKALESDASVLFEGRKETGQQLSRVYSCASTSEYDTAQYEEDMKKFRKMALENVDLESREMDTEKEKTGTAGS